MSDGITRAGVSLYNFRLTTRFLTPEIDPVGYVCRVLRIPDDARVISAVNEVLCALGNPDVWEADGLTDNQTTWLIEDMLTDYFASDACMLGSVHPYATFDPPPHWLECDGSTYLKVDYPRLYAVLHPFFIIDADSFVVPDLRQRTVFGVDTPPEFSIGWEGGAVEVALDVSELPVHAHPGVAHTHTSPAHTHTNTPHTHSESGVTPALAMFGEGVPTQGSAPIPAVTGATAVVIDTTAVTINPSTQPADVAGGGLAHYNMPPYVALKWGIVAK